MGCISDFVSKFQHGARANLFRVDIPGKISEDSKFYIKAAQTPSKTINKIEMRYRNNIIPIAGETAVFDDWTVTVINDINYGIRKELEDWMELIKTNDCTKGATNQSQYYTTAIVTQLNQAGEDVLSYEFYNIWPSNLSAIELGFDTQDTVEEYTVTFAYSHWKRN